MPRALGSAVVVEGGSAHHQLYVLFFGYWEGTASCRRVMSLWPTGPQMVCLAQSCSKSGLADFAPVTAVSRTGYEVFSNHSFLTISTFIFPEQTLGCCSKAKSIALTMVLITCCCPQSWTWRNGLMNSVVFRSCTSRLLPSVLDTPHIQLLNFHFVLHLCLWWYSSSQTNGQIL